MKKILFITYGGTHVNLIIPIIKKIIDKNEYNYNVLALTSAIPRLKEFNYKFNTLGKYLPYLNDSDKINIVGSKWKHLHNKEAGFEESETIAYMGCSMYDLISKYGEEQATFLFNKYGRKIFCPTNIMKQILDIEKPDLVITTVPYRMEQAAVIEARKVGIKTLFIHYFYYLDQEEGFLSDCYCVMNNNVKEDLIIKGLSEHKIFVTGLPSFDNLLDVDKLDKQLICNKFDIDYKKPIIVYIVDRSNLMDRENFGEFLIAARKLKQYQFVIKMHPNEENIDYFKSQINYQDFNIKILHRVDNKALIKVGDLFVVNTSFMGVEAAFCNKGLIQLNIRDTWRRIRGDAYSYSKIGIALEVKHKGELSVRIKELIEDEEIKKKLYNSRYEFFGKKKYASNEIYEKIRFMLEGE